MRALQQCSRSRSPRSSPRPSAARRRRSRRHGTARTHQGTLASRSTGSSRRRAHGEARSTLAKQKGGQVNVYTSLSSTVVEAAAERRGSRRVPRRQAESVPRVERGRHRTALLAESSAGTNGADVDRDERHDDADLPAQEEPAGAVPEVAVRGGDARRSTASTRSPPTALEKFVVAWNTNLVKDPPKTFQDLADSKWKGKLSMEPTDADWFARSSEYFTTQAKPKMTPAAVDAMFKKIARELAADQRPHEPDQRARGRVRCQVVVTRPRAVDASSCRPRRRRSRSARRS